MWSIPDAMSWRQSSTVACMDTAELNTRPSALISRSIARGKNRENKGCLYKSVPVHAPLRQCEAARQKDKGDQARQAGGCPCSSLVPQVVFQQAAAECTASRLQGRASKTRRSEGVEATQLLMGHRPDGAHLVVLQPLLVNGAVQAEQVAELCGMQQAWREAAD